ncbi:nicotinate-nucleotide diphosphorylase (carboxylating) [Cryptococcus neoformans C23]|uniref:Nicotinate-nucleotide pyrophosphorylase [carboxylating] n=2 Tax=Cryptococcus neoformans TaxID=5207 RepID=A0A854QIZ4_CRYNE|nr:nicotinate-nucleotide diphosphorylase (carboxylating) [Cryptococcus neoformans var. grubii H99]AUB23504.1 nicotinate-nucleotide diphosphorylase (carboxylating) [Cryptococcus neoformans var. grubii]OWZ34488.1 nicotinate-nucleotide diphosphorylase (carboxylating) [Cryptococcus neoformans var. grubii AD2-60a]OWZ46572.1 nicotinate-nucleotide diphosphorylase (carboxylating) [Cryptococcus neoformans var. grubii C23]OWZ49305.1 nicotinate-nucleotide diphosphorylase (carboxylating) [Cryptococcus neof|eukprot:XP_012048126.1 nicotinate-nucleotide diphosphorylase (carboxylating) [Cryptococcus neoformans var. grubii H99]
MSETDLKPGQNLAHLLPSSWSTEVQRWFAEDTPSFDWAGFVVGEEEQEAILWGKSGGVLAGVPFFDEVFKHVDCTVEWLMPEGSAVPPDTKTKVAIVRGKARQLLLGERVALNTLARCSGIATVSRRFRDLARAEGWNGVVAGTRKTTPGFRLVEKYGMMVGGVDPHRHDLSSMVMLKDNHIWATGSITSAIQAVRRVAGFSLLVNVECQNFKEADEAVTAGANIVMLDNMVGEDLHSAARRLKEKWQGKREFLIETSGGIVEGSLIGRVGPDIDILSTSAVHQSCPHVDFSLKIQPRKSS